MTPIAVLIGMPGSGKSTVAAELAQRLGVVAKDTDADIVADIGRSIATIFAESGEQHFRVLEEQAVRAALATHDGIVSLGGGAVLSEATRALLAEHKVVFLHTSPAVGLRRVAGCTERPLLSGAAEKQYAQLYRQRIELYRACARWTIETDQLDVADVADQIERFVR